MLPNRIVLIEVLLVLPHQNYAVLWRPYYDRYHLSVIDKARYYRLAYVINNTPISDTDLFMCILH